MISSPSSSPLVSYVTFDSCPVVGMAAIAAMAVANSCGLGVGLAQHYCINLLALLYKIFYSVDLLTLPNSSNVVRCEAKDKRGGLYPV